MPARWSLAAFDAPAAMWAEAGLYFRLAGVAYKDGAVGVGAELGEGGVEDRCRLVSHCRRHPRLRVPRLPSLRVGLGA